ncbi:C-type lectin domain-containing protein, partial [Labilibaculum sp. K2S]|uniref:lectin-like protein n=1 Tax=Labilibaculum sp. K2S TaxID=3056386 RepID=UPI0025A3794E
MSSLCIDTPPEMNGNDISPKYYTETNTPVTVFPNFTITDADGDDIKGLVIAFTSGYSENEDILSFTTQNGISGNFDKTKGALILSGSASPANYQTAVRSITYTNEVAASSVSYAQRELTISLANSDYSPSTGHFYEFINSTLYWDAAETAASAKTYYGLQGYLATVTSAEENSFVKSKISSYNTWLGGSDAATEGSWLWVSGPETGNQFSTGATAYNGSYVNWKSGEPSNSSGVEHCLLMNYSDGSWNDGGNNTSLGYTVEYGGMAGDPTINMTTTTTLNVVAPQPPEIDGKNDSPTYNTSEYDPIVVFPNFTVTDPEGSDIKGLTIHFSSGYQSNQDTLLYTSTGGITSQFDETYGALVLSGDASPSEYQAAVRSITYVNNAPLFSSIDGSQRQFTISLANANYFSQDSKLDDGHFYEYVNATITWTQAEAVASAKTYYGLQGYLATVTSANENIFIQNKISDMIWLGGSDRETEGIWKWVTGPESGNQFSTGANAYNGSYVNWNSGEPNSTSDEEDYIMMYAATNPGKWNDIYPTKTYGYVVEYGGMTGDPALTMTTTTTLNIDVVRPKSPGGIVDNLELWLNAEKGFTYTSANDAEWIDQSKNRMPLNVGLIQSQSVGTVAPTLAENSNNFNSTIAFDGAHTGLASAVDAADFDFSEMSVFSVQQVASGTYSHTVWHYDNDGDNDLAFFINGGTDYKFNITVNNASLGDLTVPVLNDDVSHLVGFTSNASSSEIYADAVDILNVGGQSQLPANGALMIGLDADNAEAQDGGNHLKGNIGEVVMFRKKLSDLDRQKVESYLSLKYGITLPGNYVASDGTTKMWTDDGDGYAQDIFGIGRDDASGLNQKVSKSVNAGSILTMSLDADFTTANNDAGRTTEHTYDLQFMTVANNGAALTTQTTELAVASGFNVRLAREWKVDATNFAQNISMKFEGYDETWSIIATTDGDFSTGVITIGALNANGEFTTSSAIADGTVFTLAKFQEAPGGILDNLRVWFNANSGTTNGGSTITNGNIESWEGQKPYGVNVTTVDGVVGDPAVVPNIANFNSVVSFDGNDAIRTSSTAPSTTYFNLTNENTIFLVKKSMAGNVEAGYISTIDRAAYFQRSGNYQRMDYGEGITIPLLIGSTTTINKYVIARQDVQPGNLSLYLDGTLEKQTSSFHLLASSSNGYLGFGANPYDFSYPSTADIAEYIIYASDLSAIEIKEVESYLALKYGISKADDYLASDGSTIWSATNNTGYATDIFGIGRDDASGLNQKVSKSVNAGSILTMSLDADFTTANNDAGRTTEHTYDLQFLTVANNGAALTTQTTELAVASGFNVRLAREWKVDATNFAQNISMKFEGYDENWSIIATTDGDFSSNVTTIGTLNANGEFTTTTAPVDGMVFTLAKFQKAPGGVTNNLALWLKADTGTGTTTNNAAITGWEDQSSKGMDGTSTSYPDYLENASNFNPAISFERGNSEFIQLPAGFSDFTAGLSFYSTAKPTNAGSYERFIDLGNAPSDDNIIMCRFETGQQIYVGSLHLDGANPVVQNIAHTNDNIITDNTNATYSLMAPGGVEYAQVAPTIRRNALPFDYTANLGGFAVPKNINRTSNYIGKSNYPVDAYYNGEVSEVILYNRELTATEQQQVDSYLAIKYGTTLDQTTATNYLASDGTAIWDATANSGYTSDIFGIGRDDASGLNQKVSRSVNSGNSPVLATNADFTSSNSDAGRTTSLDDGNFMLMGHNNGTENSFTSSFDGGTNNRSDRVWKVDETGTVDNVYFAIPKTAITFPSGIPVLVVSNDLTFNSTDNVINLTDDGTYYWALINPDDGAYLAFASTTPGFTVSETALTIDENAGTGTFTVVLDVQPSNDVVFDVTSDKTDEATLDKSTLTFTSANWDTPQTVTVTGVDDNIDRNDMATITVAVNDASSDDTFDALENETVAITLTDNDQTITFNALADKTYGDSDFDPAATASSELTVSYSSSDVSVATIVDGKVHIVGAGSCTIYADQAGNASYDAAVQVSQGFSITQKAITVTADAGQTK